MSRPVSVLAGHAYLLEVHEHGNDALVELLDPEGRLLASADHPERRTGTRRIIATASRTQALTVRISGQEGDAVTGRAEVRAYDLAALRDQTDCQSTYARLAEADGHYAVGQAISHGRSATGSAGEAFAQAEAAYYAAERGLADAAERRLRGEVQLALAGLEYFNRAEWTQAAQWGRLAADALAIQDPYRGARAQAIEYAAWVEIALATPTGQPVAGYGIPPNELLDRAQREQLRLGRLHLARGERYEAALALNNVALIDLDRGRYAECVTGFDRPARLFGELHESMRHAQASQNRALCLWGMGRLPEALAGFRRALDVTDPALNPSLYIGIATNAALLHYALGHFDESLRLNNVALDLSRRTQLARDEAYCLYGLGLDYYALGDRERARGYLERSLQIRSLALDGRGRAVTLRALATLRAEEGRPEEALALEREALGLSLSPTAASATRTQIAVHTAALGRLTEARSQLDELVNATHAQDPAQAQARLQRAIVLRRMGEPEQALSDLTLAREMLHRQGSLADEFSADLESGRVQLLLGRRAAALKEFDRAIQLSEAVRLQSANPELRSQLEAPLRAAYEAKIDLLWDMYEAAQSAGRAQEAAAVAVAAFTTADASRARSFADIAAQRYTPALRQALAAPLKERESLYRELAGRRFALEQRLDRSRADDPRAVRLIADIAELQRRIDTLNNQIAARVAPAARGTRASIRGHLPEVPADTVLVSFWLGTQSAYGWALRSEGLHWVKLGDSSAIAALAQRYYHSLTRIVDVPVERRLQDAKALYPSVLKPLEPWIADVRQWVIIPDGALDFIPFAALRVSDVGGERFVAAQHDVALTPAAWMLRSQGPAAHRGPQRLLLVDDPVYQPQDPRLLAVRTSTPPLAAAAAADREEAARVFERLPFTAREASAVAAQFPGNDVQRLTGLDATRAQLLAQDWSQFQYIHIATHGVVDLQVPQLSALVLGSYDAGGHRVDGAVRVADLSLQSLDAEVAVFSACETAVGKETVSEGLVGIGSTVLARGAHAVVASLWPVSDEMGPRLMTEFYQHVLHDSMSPSAALGRTLRSVVTQDAQADPALWATFQVSVVSLGPGLPVSTTAMAANH
ncbi:MAG: CHAT domain-containing protein [Proteobacteria bacterium]|nr:CHAT domain-containing protein [Pseudomonadota bacterium]